MITSFFKFRPKYIPEPVEEFHLLFHQFKSKAIVVLTSGCWRLNNLIEMSQSSQVTNTEY